MENSMIMTFKMPKELDDELIELGIKKDRSKAWLIRKGIKKILEEENASV